MSFTRQLAEKAPTPQQLDHVVTETQAAIQRPDAAQLLSRYYDPAGTYAGSTFLTVGDHHAYTITADDLYAISLLEVQAGPRAARRLLHPGATSSEVAHALADLRVDADLATADADTFARAQRLYLTVKTALGKNPWVTASKLCARKRPRLFPVRDRVVTWRRLGLGEHYLTDWLAYQHMIRHPGLTRRLSELADNATEHGITAADINDPPLRLLDALLWMTAPHRAAEDQETTEEPEQAL